MDILIKKEGYPLKISKDTVVMAMSAKNPPVLTANSGDTVVFATQDCFADQLQSEDQLLDTVDWNYINPATGPLYVKGAKPKDILKVEILKITTHDHGVMVNLPGQAVFGDRIERSVTKILPIQNGCAVFNDKIALPLKPMIGVIGTAPAEGEVKNGTPGVHGGNMDCKKITAGAVLYLPVFVEGALLALGDLHAVMGDGEVAICGVEIAGEVTVRVSVIKDEKLPLPFLLSEDRAIAICSAASLGEAAIGATLAMQDFLTQTLHMDVEQSSFLLSLAGDLRICQVVDPLLTCRMELPMAIVRQYGYQFK